MPKDNSLRSRLDRDGFVVIPALVQGEALEELCAAATRTVDTARAGDWPHVRIVGKQFPPWPAWDRAAAAAQSEAESRERGSGRGIWGVQHVLHPDLGDDAAVFARSYFAAGGVLDVARQLLGTADDPAGDDDLVMELCNLLVRPDYRDYALRWHRDDIPAEATDAEEAARLGQHVPPDGRRSLPVWHAQWNLALWPDASLVVVPGSHRRPRTAAERAADPFANAAAMPGAAAVHLAPGDAVFYDNNILHCGVYHTAVPRATLHGSVGHVRGSRDRARNVLQHGVGAWVGRCRLDALAPAERARAEGMRARLVRMGEENPDVGYSQVD